jgi:SAM-dependent methyltransferase
MRLDNLLLCLKRALMHPLTRTVELDDPRMTELRLRVIKSKPFLRRIYSDWYHMMVSRIPDGAGHVLELGSGAGYFKQIVPGAISSEVFFCRNVDLIADARRLPFRSSSLKAIVMTDVFHHIPDPDAFLKEAVRCLQPQGRILMIEPWVGHWSKLIYCNLHHEPFDADADSWEIPQSGPLSGANGALPWIVFVRDRKILDRKFPDLVIEEISPMMPLRYLVCGGISTRNLMPAFTYNFWRTFEGAFSHWNSQLGMFALFCLRRA